VRPANQGRGLGKELIRAALDAGRAHGARTAHLASSVPRYLWPGVDVGNTRAGMLFETLGFSRDLVGINMAISSRFRRDAPAGVVIERETGAGARDFAARAYPHWIAELDVAIDRGTAFAARDASGATIGFGCHSCNRAAWIGPMATDPDAQHSGIGSAVLAAVCADLDARGHDTGEIAWVSNLRFYGKCGATVSRVFQGGHLTL
jgi:GNAT superfamily N-acetyltransferase